MTRVWAIRGSRPTLIRQQQFEYAYIFGAVCPSTGNTVGLVVPYSNTFSMNLHLAEISKNVSPGKHAVLIMDNAGWHHAGELETFANITIIHLPPYSPELNPQERIWLEMRQKYLANRCYDDYNDIVNSACEAWNKITENQSLISQLTSREWLRI